MNDEQIKHMVDRFLMWKLPENFNPDDGISFDSIGSKGTPHEYRRTPTGLICLTRNRRPRWFATWWRVSTMFELIIGIAIGVVIGWFIPQPQWFKDAVAKAKGTTS